MSTTPNLPGTSPVTDNPNPGGSQGSDPYGPGTDSDVPERKQPTEIVEPGTERNIGI